jgi:hypothetical protein
MKYTILRGVVCLGLLHTPLLFSQNLYIKAGGGYRFGIPAVYIGYNFTQTYDYWGPTFANVVEDYEGIYGTFGQGVCLEGAVGVAGEYLGIEVGVTYLLNNSIQTSEKGIFTDHSSSSGTTTYTSTPLTYKSGMLSINPCLLFKTNLGFYGRAGAVLGFPRHTIRSQNLYSANTNITREYTGPPAIGYSASIGFAVAVGGVKLYIESDFVSLSWAPAESVLTELTVDGIDQLATVPTAARKIRFVETIINTLTVRDPNAEMIELQEYYSYSSVGLKTGIIIEF